MFTRTNGKQLRCTALFALMSLWLATPSLAHGQWCGIGIYRDLATGAEVVRSATGATAFRVRWILEDSLPYDHNDNYRHIRQLVKPVVTQDNGYVVWIAYVNHDGQRYRALGSGGWLGSALRNAFYNLPVTPPREAPVFHPAKLLVGWVSAGSTNPASRKEIEEVSHELRGQGRPLLVTPGLAVSIKNRSAEIPFIQGPDGPTRAPISQEGLSGFWRLTDYPHLRWPGKCQSPGGRVRLVTSDRNVSVHAVDGANRTGERLFWFSIDYVAEQREDNHPDRPISGWIHRAYCQEAVPLGQDPTFRVLNVFLPLDGTYFTVGETWTFSKLSR